MNLKDMGAILKMASSGEMQSFIAAFQAELDALKQDRLGLRQAFPKAYLHFNARMDAVDAKLHAVDCKLDSVLSLMTAEGKSPLQLNPEPKQHVGYTNGAITDGTADATAGADDGATGLV